MTVEELHAELTRHIQQGHGWYTVVADTNKDDGEVHRVYTHAGGSLVLDAQS